MTDQTSDPTPAVAADPDGDDPRADLRWGTIANLVVDAVARGGDGEAMVDGDRTWTWSELGGEVGRATKAFIDAGIEVGDRVAIWAPNCAEWVV
ncbi:MAG: AMP-binding protein, partial [Acidimicrobiales bacterium]|nr:AMP-binding protein [Acidimicrobiales bacterium]